MGDHARLAPGTAFVLDQPVTLAPDAPPNGSCPGPLLFGMRAEGVPQLAVKVRERQIMQGLSCQPHEVSMTSGLLHTVQVGASPSISR
jgi:hypothetical protein